jgi:putative tryptophan/tyrosine transport system substrate-binding protein
MHRRAFLRTFVLAFLAAPHAAVAQSAGKVARIGFLRAASPQPADIEAFRQGRRDVGLIEGQHATIEQRYAAGVVARLPDLAAELVRLQPDVIVVDGTLAAKAAGAATSTIPIVFTLVSDPVASGLVASLARPGRNLTGLSNVGSDLSAKRLQLLKEALAGATRIAVLSDPINLMTPQLLETKAAAGQLGIRLLLLEPREPTEWSGAFATMTRERVDGMVALTSPVFFSQRARLVELAMQARLPTMFPEREFVEGGGLMSYGLSFSAQWRRAAALVDKILKGAQPADIPVEQPTRFELVINLKTAKTLGLTIPPSVLTRADAVIQ